MKTFYALSIKQPWSELIVLGHKNIENRKWHTSLRGPFLIHASKDFDFEGFNWVKAKFPELKLPEKKDDFRRGGLIGMSTIIDCVKTSTSPWFIGP